MMVLLGAEAVGCQDVVAAWADHARDVRLLAVAPRSAFDQVQLRPVDLAEVARYVEVISSVRGRSWQPGGASSKLAPSAVGTGGGQHKPFAYRSFGLAAGIAGAGDAGWRSHVGLLRLFTLGRPLVDRLLLEVWSNRADDLRAAAASLGETDGAGAAAAGGGYDRKRPVLLASAMAMVRATVAEWLAFPERAAPSRVGVTVVPGSSPLRLEQLPSGTRAVPDVKVEVGTDWLASVWARQLGHVRGHLVTRVVSLVEDRALVLALRRDASGGLESVSIELTRHPTADAWIPVGV